MKNADIDRTNLKSIKKQTIMKDINPEEINESILLLFVGENSGNSLNPGNCYDNGMLSSIHDSRYKYIWNISIRDSKSSEAHPSEFREYQTKCLLSSTCDVCNSIKSIAILQCVILRAWLVDYSHWQQSFTFSPPNITFKLNIWTHPLQNY